MAEKKPQQKKTKAARPNPDAAPARGSESTTPKLSDKQLAFVEYYCGRAHWNATEAARLAGYSDPEQSGWANKRKVEIQQRISERMAEIAMDANEVLARLGAVARGSLKPFLVEVGDDVWPSLVTEQADDNFHLLKKIKPKRRTGGRDEDAWTETEVELEIHDPLRALELLGRHHKLFTDKIEHGGEVSVGVVRVPPKQSPEEWQQSKPPKK